jgi:phospholipid N-methyltransferase
MVTRPTFPSDRLSHGNQRKGKSAKGLKRHSAQKRGWRYDTLAGRSLSANIARLEERLLFAKNFLQHPWMLGSLIPSSRFLVERLLRKIDWSQAQTIVEYGPGVGTITGSMLARMHPQARLVVFEMNEDFVGYLARNYRDPRLHVVHGSAERVHHELDRLKLSGADYIISGIPFTTMPLGLRESIMRESRAALKPDGAVLVYQFTRAVLPYLQAHFSQIDQDFELRNILPARLFYCTQQST